MSRNQDHDNTGLAGQPNGSKDVKAASGSPSRRDVIKTAAVAGAAMAMSGVPYIRAHAAESGSIKFGLLEDQSGNFAIFVSTSGTAPSWR